MGTGASWIHNVQAGYCWYRRNVIWAIAQEKMVGHKIYSHKAHREAASIGFAIALSSTNCEQMVKQMDAVNKNFIGTLASNNSGMLIGFAAAALFVIFYASR